MPEQKVSLSAPPPVAPQELAPTDIVPLPSRGQAYPAGHPLVGQESVEIRSMTARDEDILTSRALLKSGKVISALLRSCLVDKTIDPDTMLAGDRNAVLIGIRITGYGAEYPVKVKCPSCSAEISHEVDLTQLPITRIPDAVWEKNQRGTNEFVFSLPVSKKSCTFRLLTGESEGELLQTVDRGRRSNVQEELVTTRLRLQVLSIGGERDPQKLMSLIRNMPARDSRELRKYIDSVTPGVDLKTTVKCGLCDYEGEVEVPLGTDFFWPEA